MTSTFALDHHVPGMSFSAERLEKRRRTLGASEVPAVLGLNPHRSPYDVWAEKRGLLPPFQGNEFTEWGLRLEPVIRQKASEVLRTVITLPEGDDPDQPGTLIHPVHTFLSCTPDGLLDYEGEPAVLQIKKKGERQRRHWGEPGTDRIPHDVSSQIVTEMIVTERKVGIAAVLFDPVDFCLFPMGLDREIADMVINQCGEFWHKHVLADVPPEVDGSERTREALLARFQQLTDNMRAATRAEDEMVLALSNARAQLKRWEGEADTVENRLRAAIGEDAGLISRNGRITYKRNKDSQATDWKAVAIDLQGRLQLLAGILTNEQWMNLYDAETRAELAEEITHALETATAEYTTTKPGARPFRVTFPKESD